MSPSDQPTNHHEYFVPTDGVSHTDYSRALFIVSTLDRWTTPSSLSTPPHNRTQQRPLASPTVTGADILGTTTAPPPPPPDNLPPVVNTSEIKRNGQRSGGVKRGTKVYSLYSCVRENEDKAVTAVVGGWARGRAVVNWFHSDSCNINAWSATVRLVSSWRAVAPVGHRFVAR